VNTKSSIFINNLRLYAFHGVLPQERVVGGDYSVDLRVHYNISRAIETDRLEDTISYADLCALIQREMAQPSALLEHVAGSMAQAIIRAYPQVEKIWIRITKQNPPMGADCDGAGVEIEIENEA
jgi:dihydroneopterin aldolase